MLRRIQIASLQLSSVSGLLISPFVFLDTQSFNVLQVLEFIGKILLKSLVHKKIINEEVYNKFMNSIRTVATELTEDFKLMSSGAISKEEFLGLNNYEQITI